MYLVCYDDWATSSKFFFNNKENALKKYNEFKKQFNLKDEYRVKEENREDYKEVSDNFQWDKVYMYEIYTED